VANAGLPPIVSIVGTSNVGKTTLVVKLIAELKRRGYRVATLKHDAHGFELDQPGKDSWRHAEAGSDIVFLASPQKLAMIRTLDRELSIDEIAQFAQGVDILLTEGYKRGNKPKIEVSRQERGVTLVSDPKDLVAIATDHPIALDVPQFGLEDIREITDLIEKRFLRPPE
jgi:molybdopterin-guanine dinucleotide biosynthesis adapter protein